MQLAGTGLMYIEPETQTNIHPIGPSTILVPEARSIKKVLVDSQPILQQKIVHVLAARIVTKE